MSFAACDGSTGTSTTILPTAVTGSEDGSYKLQVRYKINSYTSSILDYNFYAHRSLNNVITCADKTTDAAFFAKAAQYLDTTTAFRSGTVTAAPFVHLELNGTAVRNFMTLRRALVKSSDNKMILIKRVYGGSGTGLCDPGIRMNTRNPWPGPDYQTQANLCDAMVANAQGALVCLAYSSSTVNYVNYTAKSGYRLKTVGDDYSGGHISSVFHGKTTVSGNAGGAILYLPP